MREARVRREEIGRSCSADMQFKLDALLDASRRWSEAELRGGSRARPRGPSDEEGGDAATTLVAAVAESCGGSYLAAPRALTLRASRLLYREAALSWTTPFFAPCRSRPPSPEELLRGLGVPLGDRGAELLHLGLELGEVRPVAGPAILPCRIRFRADAWCATLLLLLT